jgi:hypothetical protein
LSINCYNNHLKTNLDIFRTAYKGGLESGDLVYIVWTMMFSIWTRFIIGQPLKEVTHSAQPQKYGVGFGVL